MPTTTARDDEQDLLVVHNVLKEGFTAHWGGQPFSLAAGEDKIYPRFIAEHVAKHMADRFLLLKEEDIRLSSKKKLHYSLLNDQAERSKVVAEILPKVYQKYNEQPQMSEQDKLNMRIDEANREFKGDSVVSEHVTTIKGPVENKALGKLEEHAEPPVGNEPAAPESTANASPQAEKPTKKQLLEEAKQLGIKTTGKESSEELMKKITEEFA